MQKLTEQAPNPPITRSDIFGADDTSDEDVVKHSGEPGTDRKKRKIKRMRLTQQQKIDIALHSHKNPQLTQQDLIAWSRHKFSLEDPVSKGAMSALFKDKERLLKVAGTETSHYVLSMKTKHAPEFPELENQLWAWFRRNETKQAAITGDLLKIKALRLAGELNLAEFRASEGWIRNFKKRRSRAVGSGYRHAGSQY